MHSKDGRQDAVWEKDQHADAKHERFKDRQTPRAEKIIGGPNS